MKSTGAAAMGEEIDDWCDQRDFTPDGDRIYRCSICGKRLHPRAVFGRDGGLEGWRLPRHKKKGHRIKAIKRRQHRIKTCQKKYGKKQN
jgi:hypothetical protein